MNSVTRHTRSKIVRLIAVIVVISVSGSVHASDLSFGSTVSDKTVEACLNANTNIEVCKGLQESVKRTEAIANRLLKDIEVRTGNAGIIVGSATKALIERAIKVSNTLPIGSQNEFVIGEREVRFNIKWDF